MVTSLHKQAQLCSLWSPLGLVPAVSLAGPLLLHVCCVYSQHSHEHTRHARTPTRYEKRHTNISAHLSPCFRCREGDTVIIGQCRCVCLAALWCRAHSPPVMFCPAVSVCFLLQQLFVLLEGSMWIPVYPPLLRL